MGRFDRFLGPASAPYFLLHPRIWTGPEATPAERFVGLRVYRERWDLRQRQGGGGEPVRLLVYELRQP